MKRYKMLRPDGEEVAVSTFGQARAISMSFQDLTARIGAKIQSNDALTEDERKLGWAIVDRWNANIAVTGSMEKDPEFIAASEDAELFKSLLHINREAAHLEEGEGNEPT